MSSQREKAEDFIGWKSDDELLEVVDIAEKGKRTKFKVICHKCKEDRELFPLGYFISDKTGLKRGGKPCGCSKKPEWNKEQHLILARRAAQGRFIVHGFAEEYKNQKTKLNLECLVDRHKWTASLNNIVNQKNGCPKCSSKHFKCFEDYFEYLEPICKQNNIIVHGIHGEYKGQKSRIICECPVDNHIWYPTLGQIVSLKTGCPKCAGNPRKTPEEAHKLCVDICKEEGYDPIGFVKPYKNKYSKFEYICPRHGNKIVSLHHFVNNGTRCPECRQGNGNGYYEKRKEEQDFLYVIKFEDYIKVGRTFDLADRKRSLKTESSHQKFKVLSVYTEKHQFVYDLEQYIHSVLEGYNLDYNSGWSTETFKHESLDMVYSIIEQSNIPKIK